MKKIVSITNHVNRPEGSGPARLQPDAGAECWAGDPVRKERTRGILLQFPGPYRGPLHAAAIALVALLSALSSAGRI
jgi:hypothetical protein